MSSTSAPGLSPSPFPGLRPFRRDEADIFFGREEQVDQLLAKLESARFLAVVGVSGCGKSSLVRAGMLSALAGGFLASAGPRWHLIEMRPGGHPLANLAQALLRGDTLNEGWQGRPDAQAFARAVLRRGPLGLVELLRESLEPCRNNLLLLVDQFEEIFRFHRHGDANEATAFVDLLLESVRQMEVPIFVVLTMRSDFLGECSLFAGLPEAINEGQFLIPRLTREQCRAAVVGPAAAFGAAVEPELVNQVLNDIGSNPDQLPLMQHALMRVWSRAVAGVGLRENVGQAFQPDSQAGKPDLRLSTGSSEADDCELVLTLADYQAGGGLKHTLSNHADELYESLVPDDRRVAETLFRCLSERGTDGRDIRRPARLDAVAAVAQVPAETIVRIVEVFRAPACSFLTPPAGSQLQADSVLDISHESLIRQWQRMSEWVQAEADSAAIFRRLAGTAGLWQTGQAALWTTPDLENALSWRDREQPTPAWAERYGGRLAESLAFLEASVAARDRQLRAEQERQERELELLQNMARAEKQRADAAEDRRREQTRANKQLKRRAIAALAAGILATILAGVAFLLFAHARAQQRRADEARADAEQAKVRADGEREQAEQARRRADRSAAQEAQLRKLSQQNERVALAATNEAYRYLGRANLAQIQSLWVSNQAGRQQKAFDLLRESAKVYDRARELAQRQDPAERDATQQYWRQLTPELYKQAVRWLTLSTLGKIRETSFAGTPDVVSFQYPSFQPSYALSPDAKQLAILDGDPRASKWELRLEDTETGGVVARQPLSGNQPIALAYSDDGATLVIASRARVSVNLVVLVEHRSATDPKNLVRQPVTLTLGGETGSYYSSNWESPFWFNRQGTRFVYSGPSSDAVCAVWDALSGKRLFAERGVWTVRMPQGADHLVLLVNQSRSVRIVDLKDRRIVREFSLPADEAIGPRALVSPDGKWLVLESLREHFGSGTFRFSGGFSSSGGTSYYHTLHIFDLASGQKTEVRLRSTRNFFSSDTLLNFAFYPSHSVLTVSDGLSVWLLSVPEGGIVHQASISEVRQSTETAAYHMQFDRRGNLLMMILREKSQAGQPGQPRLLVQYWDPSVAPGLRPILTAAAEVQDVRFAGEETVVIAGGNADRTGVQLRTLQGPGTWETISSRPEGAFEPSGKHFVQELPDRFAVYDAATGKLRASVSRKWPGYKDPLPLDKTHRWLVGVDPSGTTDQLRLFDATNLQWTAALVDAGSALNQVQLDDRSAHVLVVAVPNTSTPASEKPVQARGAGGRGRQMQNTSTPVLERQSANAPVATVYRVTDSARVLKVPLVQFQGECKLTDSGYLLIRSYENNAPVLKAYDLKTGWLAASHPFNSWINFSYHFWLDRDGKTAAFQPQDGSRHLLVWPFAEGKKPTPLPIESNQTNAVAILGERLLVSGYMIATQDRPRAGAGLQWAVQLWDLQAMKLLRTQASASSTFQFSEANGKALVYQGRGWGSTCAIWDLKTGQVLKTFSETFRALSPDGRFALFESGKLLDLTTMNLRAVPHVGSLSEHKFSPDSRYVVLSATGSRARVLGLHDPAIDWTPEDSSGAPVAAATRTTRTRPNRQISGWQAAAISPDSRLVGFLDPNAAERLHFYSLSTGKKLQTVVIRRGNYRPDQPVGVAGVPQFEFSPEGAHLASIVSDQLYLGNTDQPQVHTALPRTSHRAPVHAVAVSPDGHFLASAGDDGTVCFWRTNEGRFLGTLDAAAPVRGVVFSPRGNLIALRREDGEISVWQWSRSTDDATEIAAALLWSSTRYQSLSLAFSPDGKYLASAETDGGIQVLQAANGSIVHWLRPQGGAAAVQGLAFAPDGKHLAVARGSVLALWDIAAGTLGRAWNAGQGIIHDFAYSHDGRFLVSAGSDVRLWQATTGELLLTLDQQPSGIRHVALSPSGRRVAATLEERSIAITDLAELMAAVSNLGLKKFSDTEQRTPWPEPLWIPEKEPRIAVENRLIEFTVKAENAERARDWKRAAVHLTELLAVEPDNEPWRSRRLTAYEHLADWPAAAADQFYLLDRKPDDSSRTATLQRLLGEAPEEFAALEKLRPKDPLPALVRGRQAIAQRQWQDAQAAYGRHIRNLPAGEDWFVYASLCLLAGDRNAYHDHLAWMVAQKGQPQAEFLCFCYTRAASVAADSRVDRVHVVRWGETAVAKEQSAWFLHTLGLAYCRAGQLDKAKKTLEEAAKRDWYAQCLTWLVQGIVEHQLGNDAAARSHLDKARAWRDESMRNPAGPANVVPADWVEFHVLMPELEALLAARPKQGQAAGSR
jgi:WD40 repeat protein